MEQGNLELKKSSFRVRTKPGSSQGMRQSQVLGDGNILSPVQQRPGTKAGQDGKLRDSVLGMTEINEGVDDSVQARDNQVPAEEKGDGYTVKNFRAGKTSNIKQQTVLKLARMYAYEEMEIFSTRFSPDDTQLAIGLSNGNVEIKQLGSNKKADVFQTGAEELPVSHIRWKSNKRLLVANVEGYLVEYDCAEGRSGF